MCGSGCGSGRDVKEKKERREERKKRETLYNKVVIFLALFHFHFFVFFFLVASGTVLAVPGRDGGQPLATAAAATAEQRQKCTM